MATIRKIIISLLIFLSIVGFFSLLLSLEGFGFGLGLGLGYNTVHRDFDGGSLNPSPDVETFAVSHPNNSILVLKRGVRNKTILVGIKNEGQFNVNVIKIQVTPVDSSYNWALQNLSAQALATVPPSTQATIPYILAVSKAMPYGHLDCVGTIVYEIEEHSYQSIFYIGTIELAPSAGSLVLYCIDFFIAGALVFFGILLTNYIEMKFGGAPIAEDGNGTTKDTMVDLQYNYLEMSKAEICETIHEKRPRYVKDLGFGPRHDAFGSSYKEHTKVENETLEFEIVRLNNFLESQNEMFQSQMEKFMAFQARIEASLSRMEGFVQIGIV